MFTPDRPLPTRVHFGLHVLLLALAGVGACTSSVGGGGGTLGGKPGTACDPSKFAKSSESACYNGEVVWCGPDSLWQSTADCVAQGKLCSAKKGDAGLTVATCADKAGSGGTDASGSADGAGSPSDSVGPQDVVIAPDLGDGPPDFGGNPDVPTGDDVWNPPDIYDGGSGGSTCDPKSSGVTSACAGAMIVACGANGQWQDVYDCGSLGQGCTTQLGPDGKLVAKCGGTTMQDAVSTPDAKPDAGTKDVPKPKDSGSDVTQPKCPNGCNDGNPCTQDLCDMNVGVCQHYAIPGCGDPCGDGKCTGSETPASCPKDCAKPGDGCTATPGVPGCKGCQCADLVCQFQPSCCKSSWDDMCAQFCKQFGQCGSSYPCDPASSTCACANAQDAPKLQDFNTLMKKASSCVMPCINQPDMASCIAPCLQSGASPTFSEPCAQCGAQLAQCAIKQCTSQCALSQGNPECCLCALDKCGDEFTICGGVSLACAVP